MRSCPTWLYVCCCVVRGSLCSSPTVSCFLLQAPSATRRAVMCPANSCYALASFTPLRLETKLILLARAAVAPTCDECGARFQGSSRQQLQPQHGNST